VLDDVAGDFFRQREWETHNLFYGRYFDGTWAECHRRISGRRVNSDEMADARQKEIQRRDALARVDAAATGPEQRDHRGHCQQQQFAVKSHSASINQPDMMATFNSAPRPETKWKFAAGILILAAGILFAGEEQTQISAAFAKKEFERAQIQFQSDKNNPTNAWQFARAAFDYAEFSTNDTQRANLANQGIAACHPLVAHEPKLAAGHYYLAMNLGQLARTELIGALALVKEMEPEFQKAGELDPLLDHAGPKRNLGLLYRDAPGWPVSVGNPSKSESLLKQAVKLAPDYPENYLHLIEAYLKWNETDDAKKELRALDIIWPTAQKNLTGDKWAQSWDNWSTRRTAARKQLGITPGTAKSAAN
jgi:tetratricopeptide (TPR) repeat protein